jgi:hypothetical protein
VPTIGLATAGNTEASVAFTPGAVPGDTYTVTSSPGGFTATGAASPLVVTGLTNGTAYTFTATATNGAGTSAASAATGAIVPMFFWGTTAIPVWNGKSTTPNVDGAISAIADNNTGTYPLAQGTAGNQPTRNGAVIEFDGTDDWMNTADATVAGLGDLTAHDATIFGAWFSGNGAGTGTIAGWWLPVDANGRSRIEVTATEMLRLRKSSTVANSATAMTTPTKSAIVHWESGAEGDAFGYVAGSLVQTLAVTGVTLAAPTSFTVGANDAAGSPSILRLTALAAMGRAPTAGERAEWDSYVTAGCPLRSA